MRPKVCVLKTDGTNCDEESSHAFQVAGARSEIVHVNALRTGSKRLADYAMLMIPGGFSYGDDIGSGCVLGNELVAYFRDEITAFVESGRLVLGVCNGFQVLVRMGLLPFNTLGRMQVSLTSNHSNLFECRWVELALDRSPCIFTDGLPPVIVLPVANGEGRVACSSDVLFQMASTNGHVPLRYADGGVPTLAYPANPNSSLDAIAGLCDATGRVFGLMPHPERFIERTQHPNWRRTDLGTPHGLAIFENAVAFAKSS